MTSTGVTNPNSVRLRLTFRTRALTSADEIFGKRRATVGIKEADQGTYILISAEDNGGHGRDKIGFLGPARRDAFPNRQPGFTPFNVTSGHTRVHSHSDSDD
jgi:hypothetical protein